MTNLQQTETLQTLSQNRPFIFRFISSSICCINRRLAITLNSQKSSPCCKTDTASIEADRNQQNRSKILIVQFVIFVQKKYPVPFVSYIMCSQFRLPQLQILESTFPGYLIHCFFSVENDSYGLKGPSDECLLEDHPGGYKVGSFSGII